MNRYSRQGRGVVAESRPHDYIYDPNYTICSQKDFYKEAAIGARSGARLKLRPVFPTMFSESRADRRLEACLVMPRPNVLANFMPQHNVQGVPVLPMQDDCVYRREVDPTGADRARFVSSYTFPTYFAARPQIQPDLDEESKKAHKHHRKGFFVNRSVQTDYRESETQTDPYSPPYTLPYEKAYPKVLALIDMTWGKGLPATLEDIVIIERALTRRMLEIGVHDADDEDDVERRLKLMEELEAQQWAERERELNVIMECKMNLVAKGLTALKNKTMSMLTNKTEKVFEITKREAADQLAKIRHDYLRAVRSIQDTGYRTKDKDMHRNVVDEYLKVDSKVYNPLKRNGPNIDLMYTPPKYKFCDHLDIRSFKALTDDPEFVKNELEFNKERFARNMTNAKASARHKRLEAQLASIFDAFRNETTKKAKEDETNFMREVITSTIQRMQTPTISDHDLAEEHKELCILNMQKVIRGRVVQVLMRDEINQNMAQILQLKALHKADPFGLNTTYGQAWAQATLQKDRELQQDKQNEVTEIVDQLEGETLSRMFDFLDKEMVRLLDERKIHALMILAERERRMKEATEGGRRQKEEEERRAHDEIFRQVVGIHQSTVDIYLEDMYLEAINRTADANAREYVQGLARTINEAAYIGNQTEGDIEKEEMAADLVHCFILPEMNRLYQRERLDAVGARYKTAAKDVTDVTIGAQVVIKEALDSMLPTIAEHLERGEAAVDATQIVVDSVIKEAVATIMEQVYPKRPKESRGENEDPRMAQSLSKTHTETERPEIAGEEIGEYGPPPSAVRLRPPKLTASEQKRADIQAALDSIPSAYIPVIPEFKDELGEKSFQASFGHEVEEATAELYSQTTDEVLAIMDDTREVVVEMARAKDEARGVIWPDDEPDADADADAHEADRVHYHDQDEV